MSKKKTMLETLINARNRARAEIIDLENRGFVVPEVTKRSLWDVKGNEIDPKAVYSAETLKRELSKYNVNTIRAKAQLGISQAYSSTAAQKYEIDKVALNITPTKDFSKQINKTIQRMQELRDESGYKLERLSFGDDLALLASRLSGSLPTPGDDNEYFTISNDWKGDYSDLLDYISFKKISFSGKDDIMLISAVTRLYENTPETNEDILLKVRGEKGFETFINNLKDDLNEEYGTDVTTNQLIVLRHMLNRSAMWNIVCNAFESSEQRREAFKKMIVEVSKVEKKGVTDDWNTLCTMIDNEVNYDTIMDFIDDILSK